MNQYEKLRDQTILVTGSNGFIGRHLVSTLQKIEGVRLILVSRSRPDALPNCATWISQSLETVTETTWAEVGVRQFDIVFHLAGFTRKSRDRSNDLKSNFDDNLVACRSLLESLPSRTRRLVFTSTIDVYGPVTDDEIITESTPTNPNTFYGAAKLFCEQLVRIYCQEAGIRSSIVRLGHIYGPGEEAYSKLIPVVIQKLLAGEPPTLVGSGNELRDFLYVQDAVRAIIQAAIVDTEHLGPINIVRGESIKVRDLLETLVQLCGCDREIQKTNSASPSVSYRFDSTFMQRTLRLNKLTDLHHGLQDEINYLRRKSA